MKGHCLEISDDRDENSFFFIWTVNSTSVFILQLLSPIYKCHSHA
jgi:hypothetical protein